MKNRPMTSDYFGGEDPYNSYRLYWRDLNLWCRENGICTRCRKNKANKDFSTCSKCRKKQTIAIRKRRAQEKLVNRREEIYLKIGRKLLEGDQNKLHHG